MSGVPRSQSLMRILSLTGYIGASFYSPAGYVTLVKSFYAFTQGTGPVLVQMRIYDAGGRLVAVPVYQQIQPNVPFAWQGWIALNPGDQLYGQVDAPTTGLWISGAVLAGPNQFPPGVG